MKLSDIFYIVFLLLGGCSVLHIEEHEIIKIKGSDTMLILTELWAEEYMKNNPEVSIYTEGGGSGAGIKSLAMGEIDICASSRPIESDEVQLIVKKFNSVGMSFTAAKDALSIYVNLDNQVSNLSLLQLKKIFSGEIKNWKDAGGEDLPIKVIIRPPSSGSYLYFKEHILDGEEYSNYALVISTTGAIVKEVVKSKEAIGYGGFAYSNAVINCSIDGIVPVLENIQADKYPITRYLFLYTVNKPSGEVKKFLDWVISSKGQEIVRKAGYISLW